jgi:hypothetical protein
VSPNRRLRNLTPVKEFVVDETARGADGGDIMGVQLAGCCKHVVSVREDGDKPRGSVAWSS